MCTTNQEKHSFPLSLLQDSCDNDYLVSQDELREKEQAIRSSLYGCGIDIESIETKIGPSFTLFIVKPSPLTRMSVLNSLVNDPPVELAFRNARIEVEAQNETINIEIQNIPPKTVYLTDSLQSLHNTASDCVLPCAIGESVDGQFVFDLTKAPHVLVAGYLWSGKTVFLNSIIMSLLYNKRPDEVQFVLINTNSLNFDFYNSYNQISEYLAKIQGIDGEVIHDKQKAMVMLDALYDEMNSRFELLKEADVKNIAEYNNLSGLKPMPYIVVIIDEFGDLVKSKKKAMGSRIVQLAQLSRAVGIHLIISTHEISYNVISCWIKANFPTNVVFSVGCSWNSIMIIHKRGAEHLSCHGEMLFSQGMNTIRLRGSYVSKQDVDAVTNYIANNTIE